MYLVQIVNQLCECSLLYTGTSFLKSKMLVLLFSSGLFISGCGKDTLAPSFTQEPRLISNPNTSVPLAVILKFQVDEPVESTVIVSDSTRTEYLHFAMGHETNLSLPVIGMRPDKEHYIRLRITDKAGNESTWENNLTFKTSPLPQNPSEFPRIIVSTSKQDSMEPGITLLNPRRRLPRETQIGNQLERQFGEDFGMLLMVDAEGIPIWYYRTNSRISDFDYLNNGNIQYVTNDFRIVEIDILGNVVASWYAKNRPQGPASEGTPVDALTFHHDADRLDSNNILALSTEQRDLPNYYTSPYDLNAPRKSMTVMGDIVKEFTPNGTVVWEWNTFEHLDPYRIGYESFIPYWERRGFPGTIDWSHANAVVFNPQDNSLLINFRLQSAIVKVNRNSGEIDWIFGEPSGWPEELQDKLITLEGGERWFWHQHAPVWTTQNTLLLFDNGNYQARPFEKPSPVNKTWSRAVEYEINEKNKTANQVWSSEIPGDPKVVTIAMGNVEELPKKNNVLVGYGAILDPIGVDMVNWENRAQIGQLTRVREYTKDSPPTIVWEMQLKPTGKKPTIGWTIFGAKRIPDLTLNPMK